MVEISELDRAGPTVQSGTEMVPGFGVAVRSYVATLRLPAISMERDQGEKRHGAAKSVKWTCIRCGGCDHLHQQCKAEAKAVIWGIDWAKRRNGRKRRREAHKIKKDAGMKTRVTVETKPVIGVAVVVSTVDDERGTLVREREVVASGACRAHNSKEVERTQTIAEGALAVSKRLRMERELKEIVTKSGALEKGRVTGTVDGP